MAKQEIGIIDLDKPLVVVTGGGLGAESINTGIVGIAEQLIADGYAIYQVTGKRHYQRVKQMAFEHPDYHIVEFVYKDMATVLGAADVVVSRGSATFLQELAALAKPTVIVPAAHLGDQMKNAVSYEKAKAAYVLSDTEVREGEALYEAIKHCIDSPEATIEMAERFHEFAREDAALEVAKLLVDAMPAEGKH